MKPSITYSVNQAPHANQVRSNQLPSIDEVKEKIIQAIKMYKKGTITLRELVHKIEVIKTQKHLPLSKDIENIIKELSSLSVIDNILMDILNELEKSKNI